MQLKAFELVQKTEEELLSILDGLKQELSLLKVAKVTVGAASKLAQIRPTRKAIARTLTVINMQRKKAAREAFKGKKYVPKDLRPKLTAKKRKALSNVQKKAVTLKTRKQQKNFPM